MSTLWSLTVGATKVDLAVTAESDKPEARLSEHIVLDGTESIIHNFGYGSGTRSLSGYLLENGSQYSVLKNAYHAGTTVALTSDKGSEGNYIIWSMSKKRVQDLSRPSKTVLQLDLELKST